MARILQLVQLTPVCAVNYNGLPEPISHLSGATLEEHVTVSATQRIRHVTFISQKSHTIKVLINCSTTSSRRMLEGATSPLSLGLSLAL